MFEQRRIGSGFMSILTVLMMLDSVAGSELTADEITLFLETHNSLRGQVNPESANMIYMVWDDDLALLAQQWSDGCQFEHGQVPNEGPWGDGIGQNLFLSTGSEASRPGVDGIVTAWYNEFKFYDYETDTCQSGKVCGHYTQVVWANTYAVGCGMAFCETATGTSYDNVWIATCNYGPNGNVQGQIPYKSGASCTNCKSGIGECFNELCRPCTDHDDECVCAQVCNNCGDLDSEACSCTCANGFRGTDCSDICEDVDDRCGSGWPPYLCGDSDYPYVDKNCPAMCELCVPDQDEGFVCGPDPTDPIVPTRCPWMPDCQNGGSFNEDQCECKCTPEYQGSYCQHSVEQAKNGVIIILLANVLLWDAIKPQLSKDIATVVTSYCNENVASCCPNVASNPSEPLPYVDPSNIIAADGYPEEQSDSEGAFAAMFLVTPPEESELCSSGDVRRRRRGVAMTSHVRRKRAATTGPYLSQDILLQAITENVDALAEGLNSIGVEAEILDVAPGVQVENPSGDPSGLSPGAIAGIVIGVLAAVVIGTVVGVVLAMKLSKPKKSDVFPSKGDCGNSKNGKDTTELHKNDYSLGTPQ